MLRIGETMPPYVRATNSIKLSLPAAKISPPHAPIVSYLHLGVITASLWSKNRGVLSKLLYYMREVLSFTAKM